VASDTAGQREVAEQSGGAVRLYPSGDVGALAARLNEWLENPGGLAAAKAAALRAAQKTFCWEHQVPALLQSVKNALAQ
jgi:glycosyltransferase involved in cell wall biosynthesis